MKYNELGNTGLKVSAVAFGTAPLGGLFGSVSMEDARAALFLARDLGINVVDTSPYYGDAEERLGMLLPELPDDVILATKCGRSGWSEFDFSPSAIRHSLECSLKRMGRGDVDVFQLHDIDFVDLGPLFEDSMAELLRLRDEGKCRFIGMTCYSLPVIRRVLLETDVDVVLNFGHGTLLDNSLTEYLAPLAREQGVGLMNAAAVSLGLLTPRVINVDSHDIASEVSLQAAKDMAREAVARGIDIASLANQYALQCVDADTTVIGTTKLQHLREAVKAIDAPIDQDVLDAVLRFRLPLLEQQWEVGLKEHENWSWLSS